MAAIFLALRVLLACRAVRAAVDARGAGCQDARALTVRPDARAFTVRQDARAGSALAEVRLHRRSAGNATGLPPFCSTPLAHKGYRCMQMPGVQASTGEILLVQQDLGDGSGQAQLVAKVFAGEMSEPDVWNHTQAVLEHFRAPKFQPYFVQTTVTGTWSETLVSGGPATTRAYYIMERADGTLGDMRPGRFRRDGLEYARQMLCVLKLLDDDGMVHTDIKPANILIFKNQEGPHTLKVADYDSAFKVDAGAGDELREVVNSYTLLSPEIIRSKVCWPGQKNFTHKNDVHTLGQTLLAAAGGAKTADRLAEDQDDIDSRIRAKRRLLQYVNPAAEAGAPCHSGVHAEAARALAKSVDDMVNERWNDTTVHRVIERALLGSWRLPRLRRLAVVLRSMLALHPELRCSAKQCLKIAGYDPDRDCPAAS